MDTGSSAPAPAREDLDDADAFVDAHHHLWDLERHRYEWLDGVGWPEETAVIGPYQPIRRTYLVDEYLRDADGSGLVKSVHVQADLSDEDPVTETRWLQAIADEAQFPTAIVAYADLTDPHLD